MIPEGTFLIRAGARQLTVKGPAATETCRWHRVCIFPCLEGENTMADVVILRDRKPENFQVVTWTGKQGIVGRVKNLDWRQAKVVAALVKRANPSWIHVAILAMS